MKIQQLKQFALCILALFSLFVSFASACVCLHHHEKSDNLYDCHGHTEQSEFSEHQSHNLQNNFANLISEPDCCCAESPPKVFVKSETVKIEKQQIAVIPSKLSIEFIAVTILPARKFDFSSPEFLTNSFYNLSFGRAPPRL